MAGYFRIIRFYISRSSTRSNASSFKKFYKYMLSYDMIKKEQYDSLCETIKEEIL